MERIEQGQGFMKVLLDHVIELLYKAMAHKVDADEKLKKAFNLPSDRLAPPNADDRLTLAQVPLQVGHDCKAFSAPVCKPMTV